MSNQEEPKEISPQAAKSMDDIFGATKASQSLESIQDEFEGKQPSTFTQSKFVGKAKPAPVIPSPVKETTETPKQVGQTISTASDIPAEDKVTPERLAAIEKALKQLRQGTNGVKVAPVPEKPVPLDFSKLTESDVFDLDIPIEAIDHGVPDYLTINLKDPNYVARWVHKAPRRLGPMMAVGWSYVTKEDIENVSTLVVAMDENGQFRFDDVIAMKCEKQIYFKQLRKNHERAILQVNPKAHHSLAKKAVESALASTPAGGRAGKGYQQYVQEGKLEVYEPLAK